MREVRLYIAWIIGWDSKSIEVLSYKDRSLPLNISLARVMRIRTVR